MAVLENDFWGLVSGGVGGRGRGTERGNGRTVGERREKPLLFSVLFKYNFGDWNHEN
jgi:hypothetical protein